MVKVRSGLGLPVGIFLLAMSAILIYYGVNMLKEGFMNGSAAGNKFAPRCGVEFPACPTGMKCINGYCGIPEAPKLPRNTGLPVYPLQSGGDWGRASWELPVGPTNTK